MLGMRPSDVLNMSPDEEDFIFFASSKKRD